MKFFLLLFSLLFTTHSFASAPDSLKQEDDTSSISMDMLESYLSNLNSNNAKVKWDNGMELQYEQIKSSILFENNIQTKNKSNSGVLLFKIMDSTENYYHIKATYLFDSSTINEELLEGFNNYIEYINSSIVVQTNSYGEFEKIINISELRDKLVDLIVHLNEKEQNKLSPEVIENIRNNYFTEQNIIRMMNFSYLFAPFNKAYFNDFGYTYLDDMNFMGLEMRRKNYSTAKSVNTSDSTLIHQSGYTVDSLNYKDFVQAFSSSINKELKAPDSLNVLGTLYTSQTYEMDFISTLINSYESKKILDFKPSTYMMETYALRRIK